MPDSSAGAAESESSESARKMRPAVRMSFVEEQSRFFKRHRRTWMAAVVTNLGNSLKSQGLPGCWHTSENDAVSSVSVQAFDPE